MDQVAAAIIAQGEQIKETMAGFELKGDIVMDNKKLAQVLYNTNVGGVSPALTSEVDAV